MGCQPALPVWKRGLNRRSYTEGEAKYLSDSAEVLSAPHRRVRNLDINTLTHFDKHTSFNTQGKRIIVNVWSSSLLVSCIGLLIKLQRMKMNLLRNGSRAS